PVVRTHSVTWLALCATPLRWIARATLLTNGEIQCSGFLPATVAYSGNGISGLDDFTGVAQQALIMPVQAQIAVAVVENYQQSGAAQPVGEHHATTMHGAYLGADSGADQDAVPFGSSVAAARSAVAGDQTSIDRPGQLALGIGKRAAEARAGTGNERA